MFYKKMFLRLFGFKCIALMGFVLIVDIMHCVAADNVSSRVKHNAAETAPTFITLDNGMEFILMENHANPMIASVVVVKTGSANENLGNNGVSHMLEHLLFNGTEKRTQEMLYDEMDYYGGYNNAHTAKDFTNFMVLMPAEHIDKGLDIQSDMLFNSTIPAEKLKKERGIVIEEIGKDLDSEHYISRLFFEKKLYKDSSYGLPILGTTNTIKNLSREEIFSYYKDHYVPNNMTGIIIGGFKTEEMVQKLEKYFGPCSPKEISSSVNRNRPFLNKSEIFHIRKPVTKNYFNIGIKAPSLNDPDFFAFKILNAFLNSKGFFLQINRENDKNNSADYILSKVYLDGEYSANNIFGSLNLSGVLSAGSDSNGAVNSLIEKLKDIPNKIDISEDDLKGIKTQIKTEEFFLKERMHYYGMSKANILANMGYDFFVSYIDGFEMVTVKDIKRVAKRYLALDTSLFFRRTGKAETVNYIATIVEPIKKDDEIENRLANYHSHSNPDATESPANDKPKSLTKREVLPNGLTLIINESSDSRVFAAHVLFKDRSSHEPDDKMGIADFLHRMLLKGTSSKDEEELDRSLNSSGVRLSLYDNAYIPYDDYRTSTQYSFIRLETIDEFYEKSLGLLADIIINPAFEPGKIDEVKRKMISIIQNNSGSVSKSARKLFLETLFPGTTFSRQTTGNIKSVASITRDDLIAFHKKYYEPNNMIINISGNISTDIISEHIKKLFGNLTPDRTLNKPDEITPVELKGVKEVKAKKEKEQSHLYFGYTIPVVDKSDEAAITILSSILSNDLAYRLREEQGLAYSVGCTIKRFANFGWFQAHLGTRKKNIEQAKAGILEIVSEYTNKKFHLDDARKNINKLRGRMMMRRLPRINQAYYAAIDEFFEDDYEFDRKFIANLNAVSIDDLQRVAKRYLQTENYAWIVVE